MSSERTKKMSSLKKLENHRLKINEELLPKKVKVNVNKTKNTKTKQNKNTPPPARPSSRQKSLLITTKINPSSELDSTPHFHYCFLCTKFWCGVSKLFSKSIRFLQVQLRFAENGWLLSISWCAHTQDPTNQPLGGAIHKERWKKYS